MFNFSSQNNNIIKKKHNSDFHRSVDLPLSFRLGKWSQIQIAWHCNLMEHATKMIDLACEWRSPKENNWCKNPFIIPVGTHYRHIN